ncbi:MAG: hypothetical protein JXA33_10375 [Anaerolineae bacterium]|nr:hypothetical protein [Anaerolineae bacterium]
MKIIPTFKWLIPLILVLGVFSAGIGLFYHNKDETTFLFSNIHGQTVEIYGRGIYKNDSRLAGAGFRGADAVTLLVTAPLLALTYILSLRGSQNALIIMIAALFYFLYNGASLTFSAAFNALFLVYTCLFSASLYATIMALVTFDLQLLMARVRPGFPQRGLAIFTFIAGIGTLFIWLSEIIGPLLTGTVPATLGPYTTMYTHGFDSAVITPAAVLTGIFLLQRKPLGYLLAAPILILCALIGMVVIGQTISQSIAGLVFPISVYIGMISSWIVMGAFALGLTISYFHHLS